MECPICFENFENSFIVKIPCKHVFCLNCILNFINFECPLCRKSMLNKIPEKLLNIIKNNSKYEKSIKNYDSLNIFNIIDFPPLG